MHLTVFVVGVLLAGAIGFVRGTAPLSVRDALVPAAALVAFGVASLAVLGGDLADAIVFAIALAFGAFLAAPIGAALRNARA
ncbi:hypothetical protein DSM104299_01495 [Baekduia alba]|nr:hypothetical protein DSM104299_01495 [Baekduia alba]